MVYFRSYFVAITNHNTCLLQMIVLVHAVALRGELWRYFTVLDPFGVPLKLLRSCPNLQKPQGYSGKNYYQSHVMRIFLCKPQANLKEEYVVAAILPSLMKVSYMHLQIISLLSPPSKVQGVLPFSCGLKSGTNLGYLYINNCVFTLASEFRQNNARVLRFWCVKCTNPEGECIGQASKLKRKCIILSKFSSTK